MDFEKVINYIGVNRGIGKKVNLHRLEWLMEQLGHPEKQLKVIHVAGTNGKGSTSAFIASILKAAGLQVGLFTSPHLEKINERIRIGDLLIEDDEIIQYAEKIIPYIDEFEDSQTDERFYAFEILTALALTYFADKKPDIVILEAGVGGRLDATNIIPAPEVSVMTSVGLDHSGVLGSTLQAITQEKVAILKENGQMIVGPVPESVQSVLKARALEVDGQIEMIDHQAIELKSAEEDAQIFKYQNQGPYKIQMIGPHQVENACVAIKVAHFLVKNDWTIGEKEIKVGLEQSFWPGRFEKISDKPLIYLDGAHNRAATEKLMKTIKTKFPNQKVSFIIGMMKDKAYQEMIKSSLSLADEYLVISPDAGRGFDAEKVAQWIRQDLKKPAQSFASVTELTEFLQEKADPQNTYIQFGSLYLVGALREILK